MPTQDPQTLMQTIINQAVSSSQLQEALTALQQSQDSIKQLREALDASQRAVAGKDSQVRELEELVRSLNDQVGEMGGVIESKDLLIQRLSAAARPVLVVESEGGEAG